MPTPYNNPYIPGDPYSYDLKWLVTKVKEILSQLGSLDEAIEKKIFEGFLEHSVVQFHNVPDMLAADMTDGSIVLTLGYYEPGDLGALFYLIKDFNPGQCTLDYFLTMDNNAQIAIPIFVNDYVTPEMFGAKGDGTTDDRNAIQKAMDISGKVVFTKNYGVSIYERATSGTYQKIGLLVPSNAELIFNNGSEVVILPNTVPDYVMFLLENVDHVSITGGIITGDKLTYSVVTTEWCHGFAVDGCEDIKFENVTCRYHRGDGIEFGNMQNKNVIMTGCSMEHNGRNGTSVLNVYGMVIDSCTFTDTDRTAPMYGLCFEPADNTQIIKDVKINNCSFHGNTYGAIRAISIHDNDSITVTNCYCDGASHYSIASDGTTFNINNCIMIGGVAPASATDPAWPYYKGACVAVGCQQASVLNITGCTLDMRNNPTAAVMFAEGASDDHQNIYIEAVMTNGTPANFGLNRWVPVANCRFKITKTPTANINNIDSPLMPNQDNATNCLELYGPATWLAQDSVIWSGSYFEIRSGANTNLTLLHRASSELIVKNSDSAGHNIMGATFKSLIDGTEGPLANVAAGDTIVLKYVPSMDKVVYY